MVHILRDQEGTWQTTNVKGVLGKDLVAFPEGTVKLIRLVPGAEYPTHQHPGRTEYAYVLGGKPTLTVAGEAYEAEPGDFVTFPADTPHSLANQDPEEALLLVGAVYRRTDG